LERQRQPWVSKLSFVLTLKGFGDWRTLSGLMLLCIADPGFSLRSNPGLKLANAFGVIATASLPSGPSGMTGAI